MSLDRYILHPLRAVIDFVLPPRCIGTRDIVDAQGMVSPDFWRELHFITPPLCNACGLPFGFDMPGEALCGACLEHEPSFDRARAACAYNDASRKLVLAFKYGDNLHAINTLVPWMLRAGEGMIAACDIIAPVPLHGRRLRERKFNQSALLAAGIAKRSNKLCQLDLLTRTRHTPPQKGLNAKERNLNVKDAFAVKEKLLPMIKDKTILLVDDVYTTGATLNECAKILKDVGAAHVFVITIARATKEEL